MNADGSQITRLDCCVGGSSPAWSPDGTQIAFYVAINGNYEIVVVDSDGSNATQLTNIPGSARDPAWSPDGSKIAFSQASVIYVMNNDGSGVTQLTQGQDSDPAWSPDGTKIAFTRRIPTNPDDPSSSLGWEIFVINSDGTGLTNLTNQPRDDFQPAWSPDGTKIAFASDRSDIGRPDFDIWTMNADGSNPVNLTYELFNVDDSSEEYPVWSPDGSKIAFSSTGDDEREAYDIHVMDLDRSNRTNLTTSFSEGAFDLDWK